MEEKRNIVERFGKELVAFEDIIQNIFQLILRQWQVENIVMY